MIKAMRAETGMTQKEFGEYFNIPVRTIQDWEGNRRTPPEYVVELIEYKIRKEGLGMIDLGEFKLKDTSEFELWYVAALDTDIIVTSNANDVSMYDKVGKVKVYNDGTYFGSPDEMDSWISNKVINHLKDKGYLVEDGETIMGYTCWKLKA